MVFSYLLAGIQTIEQRHRDFQNDHIRFQTRGDTNQRAAIVHNAYDLKLRFQHILAHFRTVSPDAVNSWRARRVRTLWAWRMRSVILSGSFSNKAALYSACHLSVLHNSEDSGLHAVIRSFSAPF